MKVLQILLLLILMAFPGGFALSAEDWVITDFDSQITIEPAGTVRVVETIKVDFNSLQKHGIFRDLPVVYEGVNDENEYTKVELVSVTVDGSPTSVTTEENDANIRFKIGDPDRIISGVHTYRIEYVVTGILRSFDSYDELYWNVTGGEWPVPIEHASAAVLLPAPKILQASCYEGAFAATETCQISNQTNQAVTFSSKKSLPLGEELTIAVGYTKGLVPALTYTIPFPTPPNPYMDWAVTVFISIVVLGASTLFLVWWHKGKDVWGRQTVIPEYDPPGSLRPAEIGTLVDQKADTLDVSATIVDLAVRGYLTITEVPKKWILGSVDYTLNRTEKSDADILEYEKKLLTCLFKGESSVTLSDLKKKFHKDLEEIKSLMYDSVTEKQLFVENPKKVRNRYAGWGIAFGVLGVSLIIWFNGFDSAPLYIATGLGLIVVGIVTVLTSFVMPRYTAKGRELLRQVKGYKLFVSGTEKYRQPFFERENIYMEVLPYAIVFGVTKKLAQAFESMGIKPPQPTWYVGATPFNPVAFGSTIDTFSHELSSVMASTPKNSGSGGMGSSGGGFGGGGGGSW